MLGPVSPDVAGEDAADLLDTYVIPFALGEDDGTVRFTLTALEGLGVN